jgi:phage terminase small subunit
MPGRRPIPTKIHMLQGTAQKCRMEKRAGELILDNALPDAPDWMPPEAQREWGRLTSESQYAKVLAKVDRGMLTAYCILWSRFVDGETGKEKRMTPTELMVMVNLGAKLGLNPCDRVKLKLPEQARKQSKFAAL